MPLGTVPRFPILEACRARDHEFRRRQYDPSSGASSGDIEKWR
jgi:hypothetical protein